MLGQKLLAATAAPPQWNIARAVYSQSLSVLAQAPNVQDLHFKPDGTRLYVVCRGTGSVHEYALSTAWDISTASHTTAFQITQTSNLSGLTFKPDGTKLYVVGQSNDRVCEYNLSTPWSVSTASYLQFAAVGGNGGFPNGVVFKPDGTQMYVLDRDAELGVYNLSAAWSVTPAVYGSDGLAVSQTLCESLYIKDDGTRLYVVGSGADVVQQYAVSTPWNLSTAVLVKSLNIGSIDTAPTGIYFSPDGSKMYTCGIQNDAVHQFNLL